jgi:hypothetical protein
MITPQSSEKRGNGTIIDGIYRHCQSIPDRILVPAIPISDVHTWVPLCQAP